MPIYTDEFEVVHCAECGIPFGVTKDCISRRRLDGKDFMCPMGHLNVYKETELKRLKRQLEDSEIAKKLAQQREEVANKNLSRIKKRVLNGVCPCCNRSFNNVQRHMKTKHPHGK